MINNFLKNLFGTKENEKVVKDINILKNAIYLDLGNSEVKALSNKKDIRFKSCIREVTPNEITTQLNKLNIDDKFYLVGEQNTPLTTENRKIRRENIKELILYTISKIDTYKADSEGITHINLYMLLPLNQLQDEKLFRDMLKGVYRVNNKKYSISLIKCFVEGQMSLNTILEQHKKTLKNKLIFDIGGGTTDVFLYDEMNNERNKKSINYGISDINPLRVAPLNQIGNEVVDGDMLSEMFIDEYEFTKEELRVIKESDRVFIKTFMKDIEKVLLKRCVTHTTEIFFVGGGAYAMKEVLQEYFKNRKFKLTFANDPVMTNVLGMKMYIERNINECITYYENIENCKVAKIEIEELQEVAKVENCNVEEVEENKESCKNIALAKNEIDKVAITINGLNTSYDTDLQNCKNNIVNHNENRNSSKFEKMEICKNLFNEGCKTVKEISCKTGINDSSVRRYLKELQLI